MAQIIPIVTNPPIVDGVATLYKYSPFQYTFLNDLPGETFTVTTTPELAPFVSINTDDDTATFASTAGFQTSYTSTFPITFNALTGSNITESYTFNVQILPGRFTSPPSGSSNTFYLNQAITPILFQSDTSINQIYSSPTLPPGLTFVPVDLSGFQYNLQGTPIVQSVPTSYNIVGRNTLTGRVISTSNVYTVSPERIFLSVSGSSNVSNMIVGTPITPLNITALFPTYGTYSFQYKWVQVLPANIQLTNLADVPVVSGFSPMDASFSIRMQGTPSLALANLMTTLSNVYPFTLTANLVRGSSTLTASIPFTFSFAETVLFTQASSNITLYLGDQIDATDGYFFNARTYFTPGTVGISNIFSPDLRSDLSLTYVGGSPIASAFLSSVTGATYAAPSQPFTIRAVNSNGISRDTTVFIETKPDIVTFAPVDVCSTFIFSRPVTQGKTGYYNAPIVFRATATSGRTVTYSDGGTLAGTGLSLSNIASNAVQLVGSPIVTLPLTNLTVTAVAAQTGGTGSTSTQFSILPDSATWVVSPSVPSEFIQNVETSPYLFRATTLSELPVSYYSATGLPVGLSLSSTGRLTGTPTIPGSGVVTVTANTGYSALPFNFAYTVLPDAMLFSTEQTVYPITPGYDISAIQIRAVTYSGITGSNFTISSGDHVTYGITITPNGILTGTAVNEILYYLTYPSKIAFTVSAVAGNVSGSFQFELATPNPTTFRNTAVLFDEPNQQAQLYYTNRTPFAAGETLEPTGTSWQGGSPFTIDFLPPFFVGSPTPYKPTCVFSVGDLPYGLSSANVTTNVYMLGVSNVTGSVNYYTSNGSNYNTSLLGYNTILNETPYIHSAARDYNTSSNVYAIGNLFNLAASNILNRSPALFVSVDNGLTFDLSQHPLINNLTISDGTNFYASSNAANSEGIVLACVPGATNSLIVGGAADASGNHSILYGTPSSLYNVTWDPVVNEFTKITTDIGNWFVPLPINVFDTFVYFAGSDLYDPYAPLVAFFGPTTTMKTAKIPAGSTTISSVLNNSAAFNVVGLKIYGPLENVGTYYATGISHYGAGFIPELRRFNYLTLDWDLVDLSTNPLFSPAPFVPPLNSPFFPYTGYGPVFFGGQEDAGKVYAVVRRNNTTELYVTDEPVTSPTQWTRKIMQPFSGSQVPMLPTLGNAFNQGDGKVYIQFINQGGPAFPPQETRYILVQYAYASIVVTPPNPQVYFYVRDQDLPQGLYFDALTGTISGYPTVLVQDLPVIVYALDRVTYIVSQLTLYFTVVNPFIVRPQMSAAAYTALLRQYTLANAAQNSRDNRVFAGAERTQGVFAAGEGTDATTQVNAGCDPNCPPIVVPTTPFNPLDADGCVLWLDAFDSVVLSAGQIVRWKDKSGFAHDASDVSGLPVYDVSSINGFPAVALDSSTGLFGSLSNTSPYLTTFVVSRSAPDQISSLYDTYYPIISMNAPNGTTNTVPVAISGTINFPNDLYALRLGGEGFFGQITYNDALSGSIISTWFDGTFAYGAVNGTEQPTPSPPVVGGDFNYIRYALGASAGPPIPPFYVAAPNWSGNLGEVLVYHTSLTTLDRQKVEGYLAWKWNLQSKLPANHPYKNAPP